MNDVSPHYDINAQKIKEDFLIDLNELLKKYNAEIEALNIALGYDMEELRINVTIPGIYEGPLEQQHSHINMNLGPLIWPHP